jgi:hypothetical protein
MLKYKCPVLQRMGHLCVNDTTAKIYPYLFESTVHLQHIIALLNLKIFLYSLT